MGADRIICIDRCGIGRPWTHQRVVSFVSARPPARVMEILLTIMMVMLPDYRANALPHVGAPSFGSRISDAYVGGQYHGGVMHGLGVDGRCAAASRLSNFAGASPEEDSRRDGVIAENAGRGVVLGNLCRAERPMFDAGQDRLTGVYRGTVMQRAAAVDPRIMIFVKFRAENSQRVRDLIDSLNLRIVMSSSTEFRVQRLRGLFSAEKCRELEALRTDPAVEWAGPLLMASGHLFSLSARIRLLLDGSRDSLLLRMLASDKRIVRIESPGGRTYVLHMQPGMGAGILRAARKLERMSGVESAVPDMYHFLKSR